MQTVVCNVRHRFSSATVIHSHAFEVNEHGERDGVSPFFDISSIVCALHLLKLDGLRLQDPEPLHKLEVTKGARSTCSIRRRVSVYVFTAYGSTICLGIMHESQEDHGGCIYCGLIDLRSNRDVPADTEGLHDDLSSIAV